jgi:hypothetical protein
MKGLLFVVAVLLIASPGDVRGQEAGEAPREGVADRIQEVVQNSGIEDAMESIATGAAPELQQALDQLTASLGVLAARIASDRELHASAVRAAEGMVGIAQIVVEEQGDLLQEALQKLAERIAAMPAPRISVPEAR